jgi:cytochrome c-type biogenesis protein CcmF
VQILFTSFIYFTSNPFNKLSFIPAEGLGLNPMLQDLALAIHPPILYLGYVSYIVPFVSACIILAQQPLDTQLRTDGAEAKLFKITKIFSSFGIMLMTLGIGIGAWWAYRELGWGGFWFFDPVENISLVPYLSAIALHHSLLITIKHKRFVGFTVSLSITTFLLVVFSTFIVRSGMLSSIHAFASSPERAIYLLIVFSAITLPSLILLVTKIGQMNSTVVSAFKEIGILYGNILLIIACIVLLAAIIYPIIYSIFYNESISISTQYFTIIFIPIVSLILLVAAIFAVRSNINEYIITGFIAAIVALLTYYTLKCNLIVLFGIVCSTYLLLQTIYFLLKRTHYFTKALSTGATCMFLGHIGISLLALSIIFNSLLQSEIDFIGEVGESKNFGEFNVSLKNIKFSEGSNYYRQIAEFWVYCKSDKAITILKPENRYYLIERSLSQESDIYSYLFYDIYAVLSKIDGNIVHAKIYYRPLMSFIWLSIFIISCGFFYTCLCSRINPSF